VAGEGPIYAHLGGLSALDPTLTACPDDAGFLVFGDMAEGVVEVTVEHPTVACHGVDIGGWTTAAPNTVRVPASNGFDTVVVFVCQ
jgi:hypothetical protein